MHSAAVAATAERRLQQLRQRGRGEGNLVDGVPRAPLGLDFARRGPRKRVVEQRLRPGRAQHPRHGLHRRPHVEAQHAAHALRHRVLRSSSGRRRAYCICTDHAGYAETNAGGRAHAPWSCCRAARPESHLQHVYELAVRAAHAVGVHDLRIRRALTRAPPPPRTKWTRRAPHPVLIGHASERRRKTSTAMPQTQHGDATGSAEGGATL